MIIHGVKLLSDALNVATISKECSDRTEESLEEKLDQALAHARHLLMELEIIPIRLLFSEGALVYGNKRRNSYKVKFRN